jgi:hypothetical protein
MDRSGRWQFKARFDLALKNEVRALARRRRLSVGRLVESLLRRELAEVRTSGAMPDESAIREMAILFAVELSLKLQEANIPGGPSLSRRLMDSAAQAAIARVELVEQTLRKVT